MKAVWAKGLLNEKNIHVAYMYTLCPKEGTALELAASNLYRLFINGAFVGYGPARAAHGYSRLDTYDLSSWSGCEIIVAVEVYSSNVNSYYTVCERPFFAAQIRFGDEIIAESKDFKAYLPNQRVQKTRRFSFQRTFSEIYRLDVDPVAFFCGNTSGGVPVETEAVSMNILLPRLVNYPNFERQAGKAIADGNITVSQEAKPWIDRAITEIDNVRYFGFTADELEDDTGCANQFVFHEGAPRDVLAAMNYRTYDFSRTLTGFFNMNVKVSYGATLYILFNEVISDGPFGKVVPAFRGSCSNVIKYTLASGNYTLQNFEANSARFASVVITEGEVEIDNFGMILYENPDAAAFTYDYGNEDLNKIVAAAVNTFAQNAVDVLTDCPSRERAGWLCDSYFSSRAEALFTGKNLVEKSFLQNYAMYERKPWLPEGMIPMCYPADHYKGIYIPNWSMWYILELRNYCNRTGDEEMKKISRDKVMGLVNFFKKYENENGLLENLESWVFIEWSKCNDPEYISGVNYPSNMLWAAALDAAGELYDLPELSVKAAAMRKIIRELSWNGTFFEENAVRDESGALARTGHTTETCQYYAFYFDVADPDTDRDLFERMRLVFGPRRDVEAVYPQVYPSNAIVGNYLRLEILLRYGYKEQVLQECCDFFLGMANLTGTLWEHAKLNASLNHGFASMAAVYIDECMK